MRTGTDLRRLFLCMTIVILAGGQWQANHNWELYDSRWGEEKCPISCVCVNNQAHCDSLMLKHMPKPLSRELEALHIRNNLLRKIHHGHFGHLRYLKHLNLKGNRLSHIAVDTFREQRYLQSLSLTENNLRQIAPDTFKSLGRLRFFSLRKNKLSNIEGLFSRLYSLQLLNLAKNRIKKISHRTFRNNWKLIVLDLNGNKLSHIHKHAFRSLHFIKYLVLRDNPLKSVQLNFKPNIHLELLDFTNCQLTEVVKGLPFSINDLRLSENNITNITKHDFQQTKKIRLLVLTDNIIDSIDENAFSGMYQLYDLYLGKNLVPQIPKKLPKSLHGIFLYSNNISDIDKDAIQHIHGLEYLNVKDNNIEVVNQDTFWSLGNLRSLDLSKNNIGNLKSHTFQGNKHLQKLDLSNNPLLKLDHDSFAGLENLHIFEMSSVGSQLDQLQIHPVIFKHMKKLLYLDLSNSSQVVREMKDNPYSLDYINSVEDLNLMEDNLHGLPSQFPNYFPHLNMIKLVGNPWHCDLDILWLAYWMRNRSVEFFAPNHMVCVSPPELKGVLIPDLTAADVLPVTKKKPVIEFIEISLKEFTGDGNNYTIYYTKDPYATKAPDLEDGKFSIKDPRYRTTLTRRFSFVTPRTKTDKKRKRKSKSKASRKNNTLKHKHSGVSSGTKDRVPTKYNITPPRYTSLRERYIDTATSYKTLPPTFTDLYKSTNRQSKNRILKKLIRKTGKRGRQRQSHSEQSRSRWNVDKMGHSGDTSGYSSSGEQGVLLNIQP